MDPAIANAAAAMAGIRPRRLNPTDEAIARLRGHHGRPPNGPKLKPFKPDGGGSSGNDLVTAQPMPMQPYGGYRPMQPFGAQPMHPFGSQPMEPVTAQPMPAQLDQARAVLAEVQRRLRAMNAQGA